MKDSERYELLAQTKPDERAVEKFKTRPYPSTDMLDYLARKYDIKGYCKWVKET